MSDQGPTLLHLYDDAVADVYGYLLPRCGSRAVAEDLTSETFLAAVDAVRRDRVPEMSTAWLITVARNKLVDHWRRLERETRSLDMIGRDPSVEAGGGTDVDAEPAAIDHDDAHLDAMVARDTLAALAVQHRAALTLRYLDGLPVRDVARHLDRTVGATEVLLVRARAAFRRHYDDVEASG